MFKKIVIILTIIGLSISICFAYPTPSQELYINDFENILDSNTEQKILSVANELEQKTGAQVVVVTVNDFENKSINEYSIGIAREWGIGQEQKNNGVLFLISKQQRDVRIEVGYGLEGVLTDGKCGEILDNYVIPYFANEDYSNGVYYGTLAIINNVATEYGVEITGTSGLPQVEQEGSLGIVGIIINIIIIIVIIIIFGGGGPFRGSGIYHGGHFGSGGFSGGGFSGGGRSFGGGSFGGGGASRKW